MRFVISSRPGHGEVFACYTAPFNTTSKRSSRVCGAGTSIPAIGTFRAARNSVRGNLLSPLAMPRSTTGSSGQGAAPDWLDGTAHPLPYYHSRVVTPITMRCPQDRRPRFPSRAGAVFFWTIVAVFSGGVTSHRWSGWFSMAAPQALESLIASDCLGRRDHIHPALGTLRPYSECCHDNPRTNHSMMRTTMLCTPQSCNHGGHVSIRGYRRRCCFSGAASQTFVVGRRWIEHRYHPQRKASSTRA